MRKQPPKPAELKPKQDDERNIIRDIRTYRFLTYVLGGGVKVHNDELKRHHKERDERTPIRVASIRGQLRFWWRACNPSKCKTIEELHAREAEIWGSAETPSRVVVRVRMDDAWKSPSVAQVYHYVEKERGGRRIKVMEARPGMEDVAYGAFPLQPKDKRGTPGGVLRDYTALNFDLLLQYPKTFETDVEAAIWAWETFGGLGGRTRRGFGAIECVGRSQSIAELRAKLATYRGPRIDGIPSLCDPVVEFAGGQACDTAVEAWKYALGMLRKLRQGEYGRNWGRTQARKGDTPDRRGRSKWPEADTIRSLTNQAHADHQQRLVHVDKFPRGQFGMPIIFHFKDGPDTCSDPKCDPADSKLKPVRFDRMASPLVIRPIADDGKYRAMGLKLAWTLPPGGVVLETTEGGKPATLSVDQRDAQQIVPLAQQTDPLVRFLEILKQDANK